MKKLYFSLLCVFLMSIAAVSAAEVCVIVYYSDETVDGECVDVSEGSNGKEVLDATDLNILWTPDSIWGQMICKINGIGTNVAGSTCKYDGEFWNFVIKDSDGWGHSPVGLNGGSQCWNRDFAFSDWSTIVHYCAEDNDLIGFAFGEAGAAPDMLKIDDIKIKVDGKRSSADEDGGTIKDVEPESHIEIEIKLENLYPKDTKIEIEDVEVEAVIKDIDDGDDLEDESGETDLSAEEDDKITLEFDIPLKVEEDSYDLILTITGDDEKGIHYEKEIEYRLKVEKEKHQLKFTRAELYPKVIECKGTLTLDVSLVNIGTKEEDVKLTIENTEAGIYIEERFTLEDDPFDDDSTFEKEYRILIDNIEEGTYPIIIEADYKDEGETETVYVDVKECEEVEEKEDKIEIKIEEPKTENKQPAPAQKSFLKSYGSIIFVLAVIVLGLIIFTVTAVFIFKE